MCVAASVSGVSEDGEPEVGGNASELFGVFMIYFWRASAEAFSESIHACFESAWGWIHEYNHSALVARDGGYCSKHRRFGEIPPIAL